MNTSALARVSTDIPWESYFEKSLLRLRLEDPRAPSKNFLHRQEQATESSSTKLKETLKSIKSSLK